MACVHGALWGSKHRAAGALWPSRPPSLLASQAYCVKCPRGHNSTNGAKCTDCAQWLSVASKAQTHCVGCSGGKYFRASTHQCLDCALRQQPTPRGDACRCEDGTYNKSRYTIVCAGEQFKLHEFEAIESVTRLQGKAGACTSVPTIDFLPCVQSKGGLKPVVMPGFGVGSRSNVSAADAARRHRRALRAGAAPAKAMVTRIAVFKCGKGQCLGEADGRNSIDAPLVSFCAEGYGGPSWPPPHTPLSDDSPAGGRQEGGRGRGAIPPPHPWLPTVA